MAFHRAPERAGVRYLLSTLRTVWLGILVLGFVLSPAGVRAIKLVAMESDAAVAEYRLRALPPETYAQEIERALADGETDLARSLMVLADSRQVKLPPALRARVAALPAVDVADVLHQGYDCVFRGDFETEAGFACVVFTDMTGVGDVRDLVGEGMNYVTGQPVNYLTLGLAGAGLTLTAATIGTGGAALPLRVGASFAKGMNKAGKLPPRLVAQIGGVLARSINGKALGEALDLARQFRLGEIGVPLSRLFRPRAVEAVAELAGELGTIGRIGGVRAMKVTATTADDLRDIKRLSGVAERYQGGYLGVMRLLGKSAIRLADLAWHVIGWMLAAALWAFGLVSFVVRWSVRAIVVGWKTARLGVRLLRRAGRIAPASPPAPVPVAA